MTSDVRHSVWKCDRRERAVLECAFTNACQSIRESQGGEFNTSREHMVLNTCQSIRECHGGDFLTFTKGIGVNKLQSFRECQGGDPRAVFERVGTDFGERVRKF